MVRLLQPNGWVLREDTDGSSPPPATSTVEQGNLPTALESYVSDDDF
jgi:hypothetical protein